MRSPVLDALRGIAVMLVLFRHYHFSSFMNKVGWIGVDLFFVLSGFLVSGLLFKEYQNFGSVNPARFLIRRGFKIYPTFYFFLLLTVAGYMTLKAMGREHPLELHKLIYEALFIQNYVPAAWGHTWSLAVEEHFYILLALIVFFLAKGGRLSNQRLIISGTLITLCLVLLLRILTWRLNPDFTFHTHMYATHLRIDSLLFGVLVAYIFHFSPTAFHSLARLYWKPALALALAMLTAPFFWPINSAWMGTLGLTLLYLAFGIILWISVAFESYIVSRSGIRYFIRSLAFVGFYSYSIYVFHTMIAAFIMPWIESALQGFDTRILFLVYAALCVVAGLGLSKMIELPFLALREKYFKSLA